MSITTSPKLSSKRLGQAMTEYIVIVSIVANIFCFKYAEEVLYIRDLRHKYARFCIWLVLTCLKLIYLN